MIEFACIVGALLMAGVGMARQATEVTERAREIEREFRAHFPQCSEPPTYALVVPSARPEGDGREMAAP